MSMNLMWFSYLPAFLALHYVLNFYFGLHFLQMLKLCLNKL